MKDLKFNEIELVALTIVEQESIDGGSVSEFTGAFLRFVGDVAAEMNNMRHENNYWYRGFTHQLVIPKQAVLK